MLKQGKKSINQSINQGSSSSSRGLGHSSEKYAAFCVSAQHFRVMKLLD